MGETFLQFDFGMVVFRRPMFLFLVFMVAMGGSCGGGRSVLGVAVRFGWWSTLFVSLGK